MHKNNYNPWNCEWIENISDIINEYSTQHINKSSTIQYDISNPSKQEQQALCIIKDYIEPSVKAHGGCVKLHSIANNIIYISMHGACDNCPSAAITLKYGIENIFKFYMPEIAEVELVEA